MCVFEKLRRLIENYSSVPIVVAIIGEKEKERLKQRRLRASFVKTLKAIKPSFHVPDKFFAVRALVDFPYVHTRGLLSRDI